MRRPPPTGWNANICGRKKAQAGRQATLIVSRPAAPKREAEKAGRRSAEKS